MFDLFKKKARKRNNKGNTKSSKKSRTNKKRTNVIRRIPASNPNTVAMWENIKTGKRVAIKRVARGYYEVLHKPRHGGWELYDTIITGGIKRARKIAMQALRR